MLTKWKDLGVTVSVSFTFPQPMPFKFRVQVDAPIVVVDDDTVVMGGSGSTVELHLRGCAFGRTIASGEREVLEQAEAQFEPGLVIHFPTKEVCMILAKRPLN